MEQLQLYNPPSWASKLKNIPTHYVKLAQRNTPVHEWNLPGLPSGFTLAIKRDDMTGSTLSGNKVRKLEFFLADALVKKCDTVLTCGSLHSNHCRATAVAARQMGLDSCLILRHKDQDPTDGCSGNALLDHLVGAQIFLVPNENYTVGLIPRMEGIAKQLKMKGKSPYIIPLGGSDSVGVFGYITAFQELIEQNVLEDFDDIVMCIGSSGTASGIAIANFLTGSKLKCHAVCASGYDAEYFYKCIDEDLKDLGVDIDAKEIIDLIEGYKGKGYGISTKEELEMIVDISSTTGIVLDPVYTIKSVRGMLKEMATNPSRFKGRRVIYLHTGGVFGLYDGRMDEIIRERTRRNITIWKDSPSNVPSFGCGTKFPN